MENTGFLPSFLSSGKRGEESIVVVEVPDHPDCCCCEEIQRKPDQGGFRTPLIGRNTASWAINEASSMESSSTATEVDGESKKNEEASNRKWVDGS